VAGRAYVLKLHQGKFMLCIRTNFFTERIGKHWNKFFGELVESPSLNVFKNCLLCGAQGHDLGVGC